MHRNVLVWLLSIFFCNNIFSQDCNTLGQDPGNAFPVCGTNTFYQSTVPICGFTLVPGPCNRDQLTNKNPFWYKFTCYTSGKLGFKITPNNLNDDYDWQVFDITGRNPNDIFRDVSLFVSCNWSGYGGVTGATTQGIGLSFCAGDQPVFSSMPDIKQGHTYLLLVSHFTNSQSGYSLSFEGGTAGITNPEQPGIINAAAVCNGYQVIVKLSKQMRCKSIAADGTDFKVSAANNEVIAAEGIGCTTGFDTDSVLVTLKKSLTPGDYNITVLKGSDQNTILDNCDQAVAENSNVSFVVYPLQPTPMDSLSPVTCAAGSLQLVFKNKMRCNSIAANGSDFIITGDHPVTVSGAAGVCVNGLTSVINVKLNKPVVQKGSYQLQLIKGSDGNTIIDECSQQTPAGSSLSFKTNDTVSAVFNYNLLYGCIADTIVVNHNGNNEINIWEWSFTGGFTRNTQNAFVIYNNYGSKEIKLKVSNGFCEDSATAAVNLDNELNANFTFFPKEVCPSDSAIFKDSSFRNITNWFWNFGNGKTSNEKMPASQLYSAPGSDAVVPVMLVVENNIHCFDTSIQYLKALYNCYIDVPTAFTPNSDGLNDYLFPLNAYKADDLNFKVYNRLGQLIFVTKTWTKKWDGTVNGTPQPAGVYVWMLQYTNRDTRKKYFSKGTTVLIR